MSQTKREYAVSLGLAKDGRGKLSRLAHIAIDEAVGKGVTFSDPTPVYVPKRVKAPKVKIRDARPVEVEDDEFNIQARTYPPGQTWKSDSGQVLNATQVCSPCGVSLGWHVCDNPSAITRNGMEIVRPA